MIYLDNAATTKPSDEAKQAFLEACENFGNPSSLHRMGLSAEKIVTEARERLAEKLGVNKNNIYFTSGGTESNNMAILGYCRRNAKRGKHVITTRVEHPSVLEAFAELENEGFEVTYLNVDKDGRIMLDEFESVLREDTIFVSIMMANNEVGTIMPVAELKPIMKRKSPNAILHSDAVQAFGKIDIKPSRLGIDMLSVSSHKIHGIKGTGALYMAVERITPILFGGGQQKKLRSGTENVPGIAAFGKAAELIDTDNSKMLLTREKLKEALFQKIEDITFNGSDDFQTGYVLNVSFGNIKAEILLHMLEDKGIYVSTGSACSSNNPMPSHVLAAMGVSAENIRGAIRISFQAKLTDEEIEEISDAFMVAVSEIRKYF